MNRSLKKHVLVVDDEEIVRIIISDFLNMSGYDVYAFALSKLALQHLKKKCMDIAIVDINMPDIAGEEFIHIAKKLCPHLKFIIHTGETHYNVTDSLQKLDIYQDAVLTKPVEDMNVFKKTIERLLAKNKPKEIK
jgi:CheY-like chemotaxis protein